jgi:hypothetical protein
MRGVSIREERMRLMEGNNMGNIGLTVPIALSSQGWRWTKAT